MSGFIIVGLLAAAMVVMMSIAFGRRPPTIQQRPSSDRLSSQERRRLYQRLGIDPAALARDNMSNVVWLDPRIIDRRPTDA